MTAIERQFQRQLDLTEHLFSFIQEFIRSEQIDSQTAFMLSVSIEELFTNAIRHTRNGKDHVTVRLERQGDWLQAQFVDHGAEPFDITTAELPNLDVPIEQRRPGGMGLHIVRTFADELSYRHENGDSIITIRKKLR